MATKLNLQAEAVEVDEVVEVVEVEEVAGTENMGEVRASKLTANMRLITKVGQAIHLIHSLPTHPICQIPLHFLPYQLRLLKTKIVSKFNHKVRNK